MNILIKNFIERYKIDRLNNKNYRKYIKLIDKHAIIGTEWMYCEERNRPFDDLENILDNITEQFKQKINYLGNDFNKDFFIHYRIVKMNSE